MNLLFIGDVVGWEVTAAGVGFAAQRVDRVPADATGRRPCWVVTEARARRPS